MIFFKIHKKGHLIIVLKETQNSLSIIYLL